jgi:hypothetical protein
MGGDTPNWAQEDAKCLMAQILEGADEAMELGQEVGRRRGRVFNAQNFESTDTWGTEVYEGHKA